MSIEHSPARQPSVCSLRHSRPPGAAERAIEKQVIVNAALDQAWETWTTRDGIRSFFAPDAIVEARVGGSFSIHMNPYAPADEKGADDMRFLALQPKKMLSFDWNAPPHLPEARKQRTFVIVRFEAIDDKQTRVLLHHTGWGDGGEWNKAYAYFDRAWGNVLANLKKRFESGPMQANRLPVPCFALAKSTGFNQETQSAHRT